MSKLKNSNQKWIDETKDCSLSDYKLYIFLQQFLVLIHTKSVVYLFTLLINFVVLLFFYNFLFISIKFIAIGFCIHSSLFLYIVNDADFKKSKLEVSEELDRLIKLKLKKESKIYNSKQYE